MDFSDLYSKIKRGQQLTKNEKDVVYSSVKKGYSEIDDLYTLLIVFTKITAPTEENIKTVKSFLFVQDIDDPDMAGVFWGLFRNWNLTEDYLDLLKKYTSYEMWADWGETEIIAHSVLGDLFWEKKDKYLDFFANYVETFMNKYHNSELEWDQEKLKNWMNVYARSLYVSFYGPTELVQMVGRSAFNRFSGDKRIQNDIANLIKV